MPGPLPQKNRKKRRQQVTNLMKALSNKQIRPWTEVHMTESDGANVQHSARRSTYQLIIREVFVTLGDQLPAEIHAKARLHLADPRALKRADRGAVARRGEKSVKVQTPARIAGRQRRLPSSHRCTVPATRDLGRTWRHVEEVGKVQVVAGGVQAEAGEGSTAAGRRHHGGREGCGPLRRRRRSHDASLVGSRVGRRRGRCQVHEQVRIFLPIVVVPRCSREGIVA